MVPVPIPGPAIISPTFRFGTEPVPPEKVIALGEPTSALPLNDIALPG